jgi:hypothetical protein
LIDGVRPVEGELNLGDELSRRSQASRIPAIVAWLIVAACGLVVLDHLGRGTTFFYDEWNFVLDRRSGWGKAIWEPHNGHLSVLPILAYRVLLPTVGLGDYHAYRLVGLAVHFAVASLVVALVWKRTAPLIGVAAGGVVLLLGAGWQNIFWPFQIGFMGSVAFFLGAWLLLDHDTRRRDAAAAACLVGALACSGLGIAIVAGCAVRIALRRSSWNRWWVVATPTALYLVWYAVYGESQASSDNLREVPSYVWSSVGGAFGALAGRGIGAGQVVALIVVVAVWRALRAPARRPEIIGAATVVVFNWILTAISRGSTGEPAASRYVYVGAVLVIVVMAEAARGLRVPGGLSVAFVAVGALCVWGNWHLAVAGSTALRKVSATVRAELAAVEWAGATIDPFFHPDLLRMPIVRAGAYLDAVAALGSPAASEAEVAALPEEVRELVDRLSLDATRFRLEIDASPASGMPPVMVSRGGTTAGACVLLQPGVDQSPAVIALPPDGVVVHAAQKDQQIALSRFADQFPRDSDFSAPKETSVAVVVAPDEVERPWRLRIDLTVPVAVCSRA